MDYAFLKNRILSYLFDIIFCLCLSLGIFSFVIFIFHLHPLYYVLISLLGTYFIYIFLFAIMLKISKGFTIGGAIFKVRITQTKNKRLSANQLLIRCAYYGIFFFVILDLYYLKKHETNLSPLDRLTNTLVIEK